MLSGFLARKGDGEPGVKTLWLSLHCVVDFAVGIKFARQAHPLWMVRNEMLFSGDLI